MNKVETKDLLADASNSEFIFRDKIDIDTKETFGLEIEFEDVKLNDIKYSRHWDIKKDDTVTNYIGGYEVGGEAASPILKDTIECWKDVNHMCSYLIKKGANATEKTGAHIHIGSQILGDDPNNIRKFLKEWELFEDAIYQFSYGKDNLARKQINSQAYHVSKTLYKIRNSKSGYNSYKTYYDWLNFFKKYKLIKFSGVNFSNYKGSDEDIGNTVEIRCPNGTVDAVIWQNNINFFTKFLSYASSNRYDEEYIDYLLKNKNLDNSYVSIETALNLADMVFENRTDKIMFLKQCLKLFDNNKEYVKKK